MNVNAIAQANFDIEHARRIVDAQILVTEPGVARNLLTDANIHLIAATDSLNGAIIAERNEANVR